MIKPTVKKKDRKKERKKENYVKTSHISTFSYTIHLNYLTLEIKSSATQ
jgi:hypothetical protein